MSGSLVRRTVHLGLAAAGLAGFVALTTHLHTLQWWDAYVAALLDQWRGCDMGERTAWLTNSTPFVAVAFVVVGVLVALRRGVRVTNVLHDLVILTVGLLLAHGLKLVLVRDRPGLPPWSTAGDSYPSGHMANITICVGMAIALCRRRDRETALVQAAVAVAGVAAVLMVAFTRLYLRRHWLTDVSGSVLLGMGFLSVAYLPTLRRRPAYAATLAVLLGLPLAGAIHLGWHARLPSAATFDDVLAGRFLPHAEISGVELARAPEDMLFQNLGDHQLRFAFDARQEGRPVFKLLAQPMTRYRIRRCSWLALRVDGVLMPARRMSARWRTYSFPMPDIAAGHHEIELAVVSNLDALAHAAATVQPVRVAAVRRFHR